MNRITYRTLQSLLIMLTLFVLGASFYFQYLKGMQPCPLCLMQRFCAFLFAIFCIGGVWSSTLIWGRVVAVFQMFIALAGLFFAARQTWLQSLPAGHASSCLPGLDVLMRYFSWHDVLRSLLWGSGECAEVTWQWFGLSMSAWAGLYFFSVFVVSAALFFLLGRRLSYVEHNFD